MSSEDPFTDQAGSYTVTLKGGKGYEEPWLVIRGATADEAKRRVVEAVGLEGGDDLTLVEVIVNAKNVMQGASNVATQLGGTAIPKTSKAEAQAPAAQATAPAPAPAQDAGPDLEQQIADLKTKREGQQFYLANRSAIDADATVMAAMTAKMKTLS